jgi:hypothetical protein
MEQAANWPQTTKLEMFVDMALDSNIIGKLPAFLPR